MAETFEHLISFATCLAENCIPYQCPVLESCTYSIVRPSSCLVAAFSVLLLKRTCISKLVHIMENPQLLKNPLLSGVPVRAEGELALQTCFICGKPQAAFWRTGVNSNRSDFSICICVDSIID